MTDEPQTHTIQIPPERVIFRPIGLTVGRTENGETLISLLITPTRLVIIELPEEARAHLLKALAGGIVPASLAEMPR